MDVVQIAKETFIPTVAEAGCAFIAATYVGVSPQNAALYVVAAKVTFLAFGSLGKLIDRYAPSRAQIPLDIMCGVGAIFAPMRLFSVLGSPWQTVMAYYAISILASTPNRLVRALEVFTKTTSATTSGVKNLQNAAIKVALTAALSLAFLARPSHFPGLSPEKMFSLMAVATLTNELCFAALQTFYPIKDHSPYMQFSMCLSEGSFISASVLMGNTALETATYAGVGIVMEISYSIFENLFSLFAHHAGFKLGH